MKLTRLQRRLLAVLEEAGEDTVTALTNTVAVPTGALHEIGSMGKALRALVESGFAEVATARDARSLKRVPMTDDDADNLLRALESHVQWDAHSKSWTWNTPDSLPSIVLTEDGILVARQVLTADGWPVEKLDSYEGG